MSARIRRISVWIMRRPALFWLPVLLGVGALTLGMFAATQSDPLCLSCHHDAELFNAVKLNPVAHQPIRDKTATCVFCHAERDVRRRFGEIARETARFAQAFTAMEAHAAVPGVGASDEACLACHFKALEMVEKTRWEGASPRLAAIGLRFDVGLHYRLKSFDADERERYKALLARDSLSKEEADELARLEKTRVTACALCHERRRAAEGGPAVDKAVNFFARNPMTCFSCHPDATADTHPGRPLALPSESVCRHCHNGKFHGRIPFFNADKDDPDRTFCVKCHPRYRPDAQVASAEGGTS